MKTKIPQTKNEAFAQLDAMLSNEEKSELVKSDPIEYHFSLGMWIRNNWIYEQEEEDVKQMMELFDASQQDISYHINQIYDDGEQDPNRTHKKFLLVRQEGTRSVRRNNY